MLQQKSRLIKLNKIIMNSRNLFIIVVFYSLFTITMNYCINYNQIYSIKNNLKDLAISKDNTIVYLKLKNNTICEYYNTKKNDVLGIIHILALFTK